MACDGSVGINHTPGRACLGRTPAHHGVESRGLRIGTVNLDLGFGFVHGHLVIRPAGLLPDDISTTAVTRALPRIASEGLWTVHDHAAAPGNRTLRYRLARRRGIGLTPGHHALGLLHRHLALLAANALPDDEAAAGLGLALPRRAAVTAVAGNDLAIAAVGGADADNLALRLQILALDPLGDVLLGVVEGERASSALLPQGVSAARVVLAVVAVA